MKPTIVIITGLSGSGKTVALRAIEDGGYTSVDNLPPQLIESFAATITGGDGHAARIAVGIDIRRKEFLHVLTSRLPALREKYALSIVFLEADQDVLLRRFKETRRPHPLMAPEMDGLPEAISREKELLEPLRDLADAVIDTSSFTPHQLRRHVMSLYAAEGAPAGGMNVTLLSFGFKYGVPQSVDLVFDVRFLPNPHFVPELKDLTGKDGPVRDFVLGKPETEEFLTRLGALLEYLIPQYRKEGKSYLTVGIGCTGGRHRSIALAEEMASRMKDGPFTVQVAHRDI
ncbi:MAG: RNase adapter RapZ [Nitrospirota bacterium]